ncbi:MAG: penicillin acylase family protein [Acidobacteria bacterium]|nr:penicillin acylase family protein [Acidobacteriota bacterium]
MPESARRLRTWLAVCLAFSPLAAWAQAPGRPLIRRDVYGVPHILAANERDAAMAHGYAVAEDHFDVLARLFLRAQGRQAATFGETYLAEDLLVERLRIHRTAEERFDELPPFMRAVLEGYAAGYNLQRATRDDVPAWATPISGVDVLAHCRAVLLLDLALDLSLFRDGDAAKAPAGSNMWAIGKARSASGHGLLLANPHLRWDGPFLFHEAHIRAPGVIDVSGAALIGSPVISIGFNEYLAWTHTVNQFDSVDLYELTPDPSDPSRYLYDGESLPLEQEELAVEVALEGGGRRVHKQVVQRAHFGPVVRRADGALVAYKAAALDAVDFLTQWNRMGKARNRAEFQRALTLQALPMFNVGYADREGNIDYQFAGQVPVRPDGFEWSGVAPGDTSAAEWYGLHAVSDLPRASNPGAGYLQNCNEPPWWVTLHSDILPDGFPSYLGGNWLGFRGQTSLRLLEAHPKLSLDELMRLKFDESSPVARLVKDDLLGLAKGQGLEQEAEALEQWDGTTQADSPGAVLFELWQQLYFQSARRRFAHDWDPQNPLETPSGIGDPEAAQKALAAAGARLRQGFGGLLVEWGKVFRFRRGEQDAPLGGCTSCFRSISYRRDADGRYRAMAGDSYVLAVELADPPVAYSVTAYSQSSDPASKHFADQTKLFVSQQYKKAWFTEEEILENLETQYVVEREPSLGAGKTEKTQ